MTETLPYILHAWHELQLRALELRRLARSLLSPNKSPRSRKTLQRRWAARLAAPEAEAARHSAGSAAATYAAILDLAENSRGAPATSHLDGIGNHDTLAQLLARSQTGWMETVRHVLRREVLDTPAVRTIEAAVEAPEAAPDDQELRHLVLAVEQAVPSLPLSWWLIVHTRLFRAGRITASWAAKDAAARSVLAAPGLWADLRTNAEILLASAVHLGEAPLIDETLARIRTAAPSGGVTADRLHRMTLDTLIETNRLPEARTLFAMGMTPADRAFAAKVQGGRLAIVGPAPNKLQSGSRIDGSDLVVRTNFIDSPEFRKKLKMLGRRTDISYYNGKMLQFRPDDVVRTLGAHPDMLAVSRPSANSERVLEGVSQDRVRFHGLFGSIFFGRGYALRQILSDLVLFPISGVTVYGIDFFLSPTTHFGGYLDASSSQLRSYIIHDVRDTFRALRRLKQDGIVSADDVAAEIIDLTLEDFAGRLGERIALHGSKRSKAAAVVAAPAP